MLTGLFSRTNRFSVKVMINQEETAAHVPNSSRMSELLVSGIQTSCRVNQNSSG
ncbi:MAG: hypothetical protein KJ774_08160 [Firmicutes bacterium]|nr:hypothetical protein [Bacillota bacterium]